MTPGARRRDSPIASRQDRATATPHERGPKSRIPVDLCAHCLLPLPLRPYREDVGGEPFSFCCFGCLTVFRLVGASGDAGRAGWFLAKLGLAALLSGNIMMFQSLLYFGSLDAFGGDVLRTASWLMLALAAAVYLLLGLPMLRAAYRAARGGHIVLETLIALGALAAISASAVETVRGGRHLYYDSGTMVLVFVVLGQYLDARARERATATLAPAVESVRPRACVLEEKGEREVSPDEIARGERVRVRAGEEVPVDGRVIEGTSDVSEPALTGESVPRLVGPGDAVFAGSVAIDGLLVLEAVGESETLASRVDRWTREARSRRAPVEIAADRFVARFVPGVALIALASALAWGFVVGDFAGGGLAALSVLVVACPCALGIATPMATTIAITRAAARGTLLRSGAVLQALDGIRFAAFDKTGTITSGRAAVRGVRVDPSVKMSEEDLLGRAAAVEAAVDHPFARAIVSFARGRHVAVPEAREIHVVAGGGAYGRVGPHRVLLGSRSLLESEGVSDMDRFESSSGTSAVGVAIDGQLLAVIVLEDPVRPEASDAIENLKSLGVAVALLSGDRAATVSRVAEQTGFEKARADLGPKAKLEVLRLWRKDAGGVMMIGDGVNDAPALAAATAGVAFGAASGLAKLTSDVVILRENLHEVSELVVLARRTMRIVRQNLVWAFGYNAIGILMAAFGFLRPVVAAAAMVLSSLFVVGNSLRLTRQKLSAG
jgi:P-type Cu2+ transporter